ncbi:MAG: DHH family phosphoesterase [Bacilli bacterium]|nr:DHH family phosphoesterase [Bacilli bacterium]
MQSSRDIKDCLDKLLENNDVAFIVPHNRPDMDALGAAIGMSLICEKKGKKSYIVINDQIEKLESVTRKVIMDISSRFNIINASEAESMMTDRSLMIAVDCNKKYLVSVSPFMDKFHDTFILDHHNIDENTIQSANTFIDEKMSSTCEEISRLLFMYGIKLSADDANYILAGIILDTNKLNKPNINGETLSVITKLVNKGASLYYVNNMFIEDFEHDRAIQKLVDNTGFINYGFAIACDKDESNRVYEIEDIAKAADYLLKYQVNATFAIAYIDENTISISARSKGIIDVSKIMKLFGGGGNEHSAAARVKDSSIEEVKNKLCQILIPTTYLDNVEPVFPKKDVIERKLTP